MDSNSFAFDSLMQITNRPANVFVRGQGSWIWDHAGKRYLDFVQGWAVNALGHSPKVIADALTKQATTLLTPSPAFYNDTSLTLARMLATLSGLDRVFFANSGGEANEGAIKLARKYGGIHKGGAFEIITFVNGFHGRTLATMSASGKKAFEPLFEPKVAGFPKATLNDLASVEKLIGPKTIAIMLEPIQGEAGVLSASIEFLQALRQLTDKHGLLLILDEIQTGVGRTGAMFDFENAGIKPDIMTLGKGLGGGVPIAALLASEAVSCFEPGDQGGTFNGNPLMCAAGLAVVAEVSKPAFLEGVTSRGNYLAGELKKLSDKYDLAGVRGRGLLLALNLGRPIAVEIVARAFEDGLLLNAPSPDALRFMPALNVSYQEIAEMIATLDRLLSTCGAGW